LNVVAADTSRGFEIYAISLLVIAFLLVVLGVFAVRALLRRRRKAPENSP
jgi:cytochrome c biogenesis factor